MLKTNKCIQVSVVMITYGHELYIKQAIEGVLMQKVDFDIELIIADDKSPDNTESIVKDLIKNHPNGHWIKYTRHDKNKGMMPNFIWALQQASGKYIALCDGDDYWTDALKIKKQVDFMQTNDDMVFSFHGVETIDENLEKGFFYISQHFKDKSLVPKKIFIEKGGGGFGTASIMFKKKIVEKLPDYFFESSVGDLPLALLAISKGEIGFLKDNMSTYRLMSSNSWSKSITQEQKLSNNLNARQTIDKFHIETNNQFVYTTKHLTRNNIFYSILYNSKGSKLKLFKLMVKHGAEIGLKNFLRCVKLLFK